MFTWLCVVRSIKDEMLVKICGTDTALYLIFLRNASIYFGFISLVNIAFIIIYLTGEPTDS